jgi:hypothetical protein
MSRILPVRFRNFTLPGKKCCIFVFVNENPVWVNGALTGFHESELFFLVLFCKKQQTYTYEN